MIFLSPLFYSKPFITGALLLGAEADVKFSKRFMVGLELGFMIKESKLKNPLTMPSRSGNKIKLWLRIGGGPTGRVKSTLRIWIRQCSNIDLRDLAQEWPVYTNKHSEMFS